VARPIVGGQREQVNAPGQGSGNEDSRRFVAFHKPIARL